MLQDRVAIVTGAGQGIGRAIVVELARAGAHVVASGRRLEPLEAVAGEARALGRRALAVSCDVGVAAQVEHLVAETVREFGRVDLLVNNAGYRIRAPLDRLPRAEWDAMITTNLTGVFLCCQAAGRVMIAQRAGKIVNITSVAGRAALPFMGPYAASKFGLEAISDSLRRELIPVGVKVVVIEPASFQSRIWNKVEEMDLSRYRGTPYERVMERVRQGALMAAEHAPPPDKVVSAVERALTARRPPIRVVVAPRFMTRVWLWLPDRWLDWVIARGWRKRR